MPTTNSWSTDRNPKKPLTRISKRVPGVHGKRSLERGWQKRFAQGLSKAWRRVGTGLAKGWQRVGGFPSTLQIFNSGNARLEERVCDSFEVGSALVLCCSLGTKDCGGAAATRLSGPRGPLATHSAL